MSPPLAVGICGASGRMGRQLCRLAEDDERFGKIFAIDHDSDWAALPALDVIVDFSSPEGFVQALTHCRAHGIALVSGTTGMDVDAALNEAAGDSAVLHAANFSLGVAVLRQLVASAAAMLPDWDLEIIEAHHGAKVDAPSGTALALGEAAAAARGVELAQVEQAGRAGHTGRRPAGEIGFASIRAADIVGEHTVLLAAKGERIELGHRATDRAIFARGALQAAVWLAGQPAGRYRIEDMLAAPAP